MEKASSLIAGLLATFVIFFASLTIYLAHMDTIKQNMLDTAVSDFVNDARSSAVITDEAYEKLVREVSNTGVLCKIEIIHESRYAYLDGSDVGIAYYHYGNDDILNAIYTPSGANGKYYMKNGDKLGVTIYNTKPTLGIQVFRMFLGNKGLHDTSLYAHYVREIGNNPQ